MFTINDMCLTPYILVLLQLFFGIPTEIGDHCGPDLYLPLLLLPMTIIVSFPSTRRVLYKTLYHKVSQIHAAGFILAPRLPLSIYVTVNDILVKVELS